MSTKAFYLSLLLIFLGALSLSLLVTNAIRDAFDRYACPLSICSHDSSTTIPCERVPGCE